MKEKRLKKMVKVLSAVLSVTKYLLAIFMIVAGIATMFAPLLSISGPLGFVYSSRIMLVLFGGYFATSGAVLLYGKIRKRANLIGLGLMLVYLAFFFSMIIQGMAMGDWGNLIGVILTGFLYLRWKYHLLYAKENDVRDYGRNEVGQQ